MKHHNLFRASKLENPWSMMNLTSGDDAKRNANSLLATIVKTY